ncbi:monovalent cation:proton antiporter-2 (CPA2) family protein [Maricaulis parjimensis]|uniref:monovalent cation:proton antiporter-2 (CPA2) family protein n=1 Tax=Maricaulis parjimensis TaxID=144023 RepID=UPI00193965A7|nr:monovalent cation:proton antiporter-2 (CPA2) family protein [Maricaulis parjimensis]
MNDLLIQAAIYLGAGVLAVPIAHRLGLGSVLGYLLAGVAIAPLLDWVGSNPENVQHFAEFGVVMMLFLVGLELQPRLLWELRLRLFGLGGLQVVTTMTIVALLCILAGIEWRLSIALGMIFALSSTAIVLQTLGEKGWLRTEGGQSSFSVLLFQDIAVIPMLAFLPFLALPGAEGVAGAVADGHGAGDTPISHLPAWAQGLATLAAVAIIIVGGRYLTRPAFRIIARTGLHELFFAAALLLIIGIAVLMSLVGLSPALGTFLAGVLLAESEYRHELVSDLEPFKGLLLGVFFVTVGANMNFALLSSEATLVIGLTIGLIALKGLILLALAVLFRMKGRARWLFTFALAQSGEFGFVLLAYGTGVHVLPDRVADIAALVVALSMMATPLIMTLFERVVSPRVARRTTERMEDEIEEEAPVIIAGMGRFGQIVHRLLVMDGIKPIVLDNSAEHIDGLRKFGIQVYYGNALRPGLLEAAGIARAKLLVVCTDNRERAVELVHHVKSRYPHVHVIARASSREHVYQLRAAGADSAIREMFGSSLEAATQSLEVLGQPRERAERKAAAFAKHDEESLQQLFEVWDSEIDVFDNEAYIEKARSRVMSLEEIMAEDVGEPSPEDADRD